MEKPETYIKDDYIDNPSEDLVVIRNDSYVGQYDISDGFSSIFRITQEDAVMWDKDLGKIIWFQEGVLMGARANGVSLGIQDYIYILKPDIQKQLLKYKL